MKSKKGNGPKQITYNIKEKREVATEEELQHIECGCLIHSKKQFKDEEVMKLYEGLRYDDGSKDEDLSTPTSYEGTPS